MESKYNDTKWIGEKIGKLTVIEIVHVNRNGKQHAGWQWRCKCECGNETLARPSLVLSGKKLSCGCLKKELARQINFIDLTGEKFGKLLVISEA